MAITFTWSIKDMHKVTSSGAVYRVDWSCAGVDADTSTSRSRSGSYLHTNDDGDPATPDHTASDFVAYDALDEATVLGWVKDNGVQAYNEGLITTNINNIIAAAAANSSGIPWAAE
jgi:hypothetical protein